MERQWQLRPPIIPPPDLLDFVQQDAIIAGYLVQRGITTPEQAARFLDPDKKNLADPKGMPDMGKAVDRILIALNSHEKIGIWGDFDADGQTATAVLVECLTNLGADVEYYLPVRGKESHGITIPSLQNFLEKGIRLLITCDTGITENEAVQYAVDNGVDVIITDHHTLPDTLPAALACINPRRLPEDHPLGSLSGSGAAFELMLAICRSLDKEYIAFESIDLAAIGLIADLAPLKNDSRLIAQLGLERITDHPRQCIKSLLEAAKMAAQTIDEQTVGYTIGPRLNAAGRLDDANPLVMFLMDQESAESTKETAERLEAFNANRKWLCDQVFQAARGQLERQKELAEEPVIILSHPTWPGGVLGLVAGQLAVEFNRPAIILNDSSDGLLRGSARSVEGINITEAIASASDLLIGYGGHPMAAGLSLPTEKLPEFRRSVNRFVLDHGLDVTALSVIDIDSELDLPQITPEFHYSLQKLGPFGNENPPLVFCTRRVQITSSKSLGRSREHFRFVIQNEDGDSLPIVWWNTEEESIPSGWFDIAYSLNINEYKGKITLQGVWLDHHVVEEAEELVVIADAGKIIDLRMSLDPVNAAVKACDKQPYLIYQEPVALDRPESTGRNHLYPVNSLILASIPPSRQVLEHILLQAQPRQIVFAFENTAESSLSPFLKHLAGLIRYAISNREGLASLTDLAEAMNTTEQTIEAGIQWLIASGKIDVKATDQNLYRFVIRNADSDPASVKKIEDTLRYLLKETSSFQKYLYSLPGVNIAALLSGISGNKSVKKQ